MIFIIFLVFFQGVDTKLLFSLYLFIKTFIFLNFSLVFKDFLA